jgi:hypothetical protein
MRFVPGIVQAASAASFFYAIESERIRSKGELTG